MLNNLIEEFKDRIDISDFYSYVNFEIVKEELISSNQNIIFLLGAPGSGKSFMLSYIKSLFPQNYLLITEPFESKEEFFKKYELNQKILIDEAQLLSLEMIEFLRILSDRGHQVILSMHEKEGEKIAYLPQFNSRYTQKIYMKPLSFEEFEKYVVTKFIKHEKKELINRKMLKKIYKFTKGNFRLSKKFVFTALNLLNYSYKNALRYKTLDRCIVEMSAIELGLLK